MRPGAAFKTALCALGGALALLASTTRIAHAADERIVVVMGSPDDGLVPRLASELAALEVLALTRTNTRDVGASMNALHAEIACVVTDSAVELWSRHDGDLQLDERIARDASGDAITQAAERVRARMFRAHVVAADSPREDPGRIELDATLGFVMGPAFGGPPDDQCQGSCSASLATGGRFDAALGYRLARGLGAAVHLGYSTATVHYRGRAAQADPVGFPTNPGTSDDAIALRGPHLGAGASYEHSSRFHPSIGAGVGVLFLKFEDTRVATFTTVPVQGNSGVSYSVPEQQESGSVSAPYVQLELRARYELSERFSLVAGATGTLLAGQDEVRWMGTGAFHTGRCPSPDPDACQGIARIAAERITGASIVTVTPFIGMRASF